MFRFLSDIIHGRRSSVAAIVDVHGGIRVVVTPRWRMRFHCGEGERLYIVPGLRVKEPVEWDRVPRVIECALAAIR